MDFTLPLSIGILSEECINCGALSFLAEYGRKNHNCKVELAIVNYPESLKRLMLGNHSYAMRTFPGVGERAGGQELPSKNILFELSFVSVSVLQ